MKPEIKSAQLAFIEEVKSIYKAELHKEVSTAGGLLSKLWLVLLLPVFILAAGDVALAVWLAKSGYSIWGMIALGIFGLTTAFICGISLGFIFGIGRLFNAGRNILDICLKYTIQVLKGIEQKLSSNFDNNKATTSDTVFNSVREDVYTDVKTGLRSRMKMFFRPVSFIVSFVMNRMFNRVSRSVKKESDPGLSVTLSPKEKSLSNIGKGIVFLTDLQTRSYNFMNDLKWKLSLPWFILLIIYSIFSALIMWVIIAVS